MKKAVLKVRTLGDPCLRRPSVALESVGVSERMLIRAMAETMYEEEGVGLAAPQIGVNKQIIVVDDGKGLIAMINPDIVKAEGKAVMEEGCLSVPNGCVKVERAETIRVRFLDDQGTPRELECSGLLSRAVQHEMDHLQGKMIVDYANDDEKKKIKEHFPDVQF
ncbi:MAG TPA: peptide deformylase [Candidatus Bathyarchaeia archaeon]|nr:peptide deformylase [Candidatus Bathyarchaeia archaeon]